MLDQTGFDRRLPQITVEQWELPRVGSRIYRNFGKRAFDIGLVLLILPFLLPLVAGLAALVRLDGGPAFYRQILIGRAGRRFRCFKLRSMIADGEAVLTRYLERHPEERQNWYRSRTLANDPRLTWIGHLLRRTHLDELPMFYNVLLGDMAIVGPHPLSPLEEGHYRAMGGGSYYALNPGMTGPWQVSSYDRHALGARVGYDESYDMSLCLKTDIRLVLTTIITVLREVRL